MIHYILQNIIIHIYDTEEIIEQNNTYRLYIIYYRT